MPSDDLIRKRFEEYYTVSKDPRSVLAEMDPRLWELFFPHVPKVQRVVKEADVEKYLQKDWTFVTQLKSGDVILETAIDTDQVLIAALDQVKRQL